MQMHGKHKLIILNNGVLGLLLNILTQKQALVLDNTDLKTLQQQAFLINSKNYQLLKNLDIEQQQYSNNNIYPYDTTKTYQTYKHKQKITQTNQSGYCINAEFLYKFLTQSLTANSIAPINQELTIDTDKDCVTLMTATKFYKSELMIIANEPKIDINFNQNKPVKIFSGTKQGQMQLIFTSDHNQNNNILHLIKTDNLISYITIMQNNSYQANISGNYNVLNKIKQDPSEYINSIARQYPELNLQTTKIHHTSEIIKYDLYTKANANQHKIISIGNAYQQKSFVADLDEAIAYYQDILLNKNIENTAKYHNIQKINRYRQALLVKEKLVKSLNFIIKK